MKPSEESFTASKPRRPSLRWLKRLGCGLLILLILAVCVWAWWHHSIQQRLDEALAELATHVANLAILIDPARIAVGGGLMSSGELILQALAFRLSYAVPFPPEIVPARFLNDASLHGAIALALTESMNARSDAER